MGWTPVNKITIERIFEPTRQIIVSWEDGILGKKEKRFTFEEADEALKLLSREFKSLCM